MEELKLVGQSPRESRTCIRERPALGPVLRRTIPLPRYHITPLSHTRLPRTWVASRSWVAPGFTMIELLIVIALIMILATMGMAQYKSSVTHSKEAVLSED